MALSVQLITLSGIDGSGKSTLAYSLQDYLKQQFGLKCRCVWCKFGEHPFLKQSGTKDDGQRSTELDGSNSYFTRFGVIKTVYFLILMFFHLSKIYFRVLRPLKKGEIIICDRYIFDTYVDLAQEQNFNVSLFKRLLGAKWIPEPGWKFLLDLSEGLAQSRKNHSSESYLSERRSIYLDIAREHGLKIIDAGFPPDKVFHLIADEIQLIGDCRG